MTLLPIDFHAHVSAMIGPDDLKALNAVVFAATPSLDEASVALRRHDALTVWGVGCHPGLVRSQRAFDVSQFRDLVASTAFVSEVGLDGDSRVPLPVQAETLREILAVMQEDPRIVSLHSYRASAELLTALRATPSPGLVLHWWLGSPDETRLALDLGCYFSFNASSVRRTDLLDIIPISRILTETDHPAGDRFVGPTARPGNLTNVERALASHYKCTTAAIRRNMWENLDRLVIDTDVGHLLPRGVRVHLGAL